MDLLFAAKRVPIPSNSSIVRRMELDEPRVLFGKRCVYIPVRTTDNILTAGSDSQNPDTNVIEDVQLALAP